MSHLSDDRYRNFSASESSGGVFGQVSTLGSVLMVSSIVVGFIGMILGAVSIARINSSSSSTSPAMFQFPSTYPISTTGIYIENADFDPYAQSIYLGSVATGTVFSLNPVTAAMTGAPVSMGGTGVSGIDVRVPGSWTPAPSSVVGSFGVLVDTSGSRYTMWIGRGNFPPTTTGGMTRVDLRTNAKIDVPFPSSPVGSQILINDITVDPASGNPYFTDIIGGKIFSMNANGTSSTLNLVQQYDELKSNLSISVLGVDGIAYYKSSVSGTRYLIVSYYGSLSPSGAPSILYRINLETLSLTPITLPAGLVIRGADQVRFLNPSMLNRLYITCSVVSPTNANVYVLDSTDDFSSVTLVEKLCAPVASCNSPTPGSVFIPGPQALYAACGLTPDPSSLARLDSSNRCSF